MQRYWIDIRDIPLNRTVEHSCGAVVCRGEGEARRVLLIRSHNGYWGFPKGHMEQGETRQETAIRETREETGCTVQLLDDFCTEEAYTLTREGRPDTIKQVTYFLACTDQQEVRPQTSEVAEIRWVDFGTAQELLQFESSRRILREAEQYLNGR
ncbi:MAG: NUDIX domain-containing protein [Butyrivibrio sp.]|nr:NUDIX domain-containing protein [Butyrivibrio sp.]